VLQESLMAQEGGMKKKAAPKKPKQHKKAA
jgi:hypothetical protein